MIGKAHAFIKQLWSAAPVATAILVFALLCSLFFVLRAAVFFPDRVAVVENGQRVAEWMTPRYISRSWGIPPDVILDALDAPTPPPNGPMDLAELAEFRGVPTTQVIAEVEALIAAFHAQRPPRPGRPPRAVRND